MRKYQVFALRDRVDFDRSVMLKRRKTEVSFLFLSNICQVVSDNFLCSVRLLRFLSNFILIDHKSRKFAYCPNAVNYFP